MAELSDEVEKDQISLPSLYETCFKVLSSEFGLIQKKYIKGVYICKMYVLDSPNCTTRILRSLLILQFKRTFTQCELSLISGELLLFTNQLLTSGAGGLERLGQTHGI